MSDNERITAVFSTLAEKLASGLSDLLGCSIEVELTAECRTSKAKFFSGFHKKLVMANFDVAGSREGRMFCFCRLKDAVLLGGTLIMLPPAELDKKVRKEEFNEDEADAYGEIVNIVSGELIQAFDEVSADKLHFKKTGIDVVLPGKVVLESPEPFPDGELYQVSFRMNLEEQPLESMEMLFPLSLLGISGEEMQAESWKAVSAAAESAETEPSSEASEHDAESGKKTTGELVLLVTGRKDEVHDLADACVAEGFVSRVCGYQEDFQSFGPNGPTPARGVILSMDDTKEQGLASIIKAKGIFGNSVPLIAAGGRWTRSQVLQAVKYGVCDIVVTPASPDDIREKIRQNLGSMKN
ncbi:MAG: hypothetical protein PWP34_721 [Desulfuromonadales bacterium]|jgi:chemotaxis protein CheY-P-specific phosphatase CheC|nr:hypothetical protein [Desulfuromonadales bacterium]